MHSADIQNLELQGKNENKNGYLCIVMVIETIWKCREHIQNKDTYAYIMTLFETVFETTMGKTVHVLT